MPVRIQLKNVRLSFHDLFERGTYEGKEVGYSATFILPPDHPQIDEIRRAERKVHADKWGTKKVSLKADSGVLRDGDEKAHIDGFEGMLYIKANTEKRPGVFDRNLDPLTKDDGRPYSGCYVNAVIDVWAQDNGYGKAIRAGLGGVQFLRDGDSFGGAAPARADDFDAVDGDDEFADALETADDDFLN
jgi:hypothetical protein